MEPIYDDTYGGRALVLEPLDMNGSGKKRRKRKRSKKKSQSPETIIPKRIDYVLVYKHQDVHTIDDAEDAEEFLVAKALRERFQDAMVTTERLEIQEEPVGEYTYVKIHCPFSRLCKEAQDVKLEMPLKGAEIISKTNRGCCGGINRRLKTDTEADWVSAPFIIQKRSVYEGIDNPETFFRSATRSYMVHHILINMDVRKEDDRKDGDFLKRKGLPYMLLRKVYSDGFILHDESPYEELDEDERDAVRKASEKAGDFEALQDPREDLQRTWGRWTKYQPLWRIRNYFGEQIAFYFAWAGAFATYLWLPMFLGLATWGYGLFLSIENWEEHIDKQNAQIALLEELQVKANRTPYEESLLTNLTAQYGDQSVVTMITDAGLTVFKNSFDSDVTPFFALVICLWGTLFQEIWKRKQVRLAYEWDVDEYELSEPDRPEFYGTKERPDPVSGQDDWYYPFYKTFLKFVASFSILIFMTLLVIVSVISVIIYRLFTAALLSEEDTLVQLLVSSLVASLLNSVSILLLGKIYEKIAFKLNDWENHRTRSTYENALIIKLFAFQFVNSYSSLFYIAFFRGQDSSFLGIESLGSDSCTDNNCMSMLSLQVFVLMLVKPFPKFLKDIILPFVVRKFKKRRCCRGSQVNGMDEEKLTPHAQYLMKEKGKQPVGDLTLGEYNEKVIMYGFLMLFSVALPLAPLIAICVVLIDLRVDGKRLLWFNRRPVAFIASNTGMWFDILNFINFAGVVSNAFLIAFRSQWGQKYDDVEKLWIVIGFEHIVFAVKFFIQYIIPDVPSDVALAMRKEKFEVAKILDSAENLPPMKSKEFLTPVVPCRPDFKGLNYFGSNLASIVSNSQSLDGSLNGSVFENGLSPSHKVEDTFEKDQKESQVPADQTELTYGENGDTFLTNDTTSDLPPLLPPEPSPVKKRKKKKGKSPRPADPDLPPIQGNVEYSVLNPNLAYPPNYGFAPHITPDVHFDSTNSSIDPKMAYPLPVQNTFNGPF